MKKFMELICLSIFEIKEMKLENIPIKINPEQQKKFQKLKRITKKNMMKFSKELA